MTITDSSTDSAAYTAHTHAMTDAQRQAAGALLADFRRAGSVRDFAWRQVALGGVTLVIGLGLLLWVARNPISTTANLILALIASLLAIVGMGLLGYGVVRMLLGQLMAGRGKDQRDRTLALLDAELKAQQVESITIRLDALAPVDVPVHYRFWIARAGPHYIGLEAADLFPRGTAHPIPCQTLRLTVLPTSRRVLSVQWDGPPVPMTDRPIPEADVPDFARGYRPLRRDHFTEAVHALLP